MIPHKLFDESLIPSLDPNSEWVVTNGCFDLFGPHHAYLLRYLGGIKQHLNRKLVVGINSDDSVRRLKGDSRPIQSETERAFMVSNHEAVDLVFIFDYDSFVKPLHLLNKRANHYEWFKGGDYTTSSLDPEELKEYASSRYSLLSTIEDVSVRIPECSPRCPSFVPRAECRSTTETIKYINESVR